MLGLGVRWNALLLTLGLGVCWKALALMVGLGVSKIELALCLLKGGDSALAANTVDWFSVERKQAGLGEREACLTGPLLTLAAAIGVTVL
jgi:hypothetical protein